MKKTKKKISESLGDILSGLVDIQTSIEKFPVLSAVEKAKLEQSIAIDQLYYSSKLEGTNLTEKMIDKVIHGQNLPAS